ncbi:MAG TPA: hypothetical protein VGC65_00180 [Bacteroidia bacterium]|jgi:hypothetical protein
MEKTYNFKIEKPTEAQCLEAMKAAADIVRSLPHADLLYLADLSKRKPTFVTKAKPYEKYL